MEEFEDDEFEDNFDPNDTEEDIDDDFDPNDTEEDVEDDFDPNDTEEDIDDDFDPNDTEEDIDDDFDPNDIEEDIDDDFDPNDYEEDFEDDFDPNDNEEDLDNDFDPNDYIEDEFEDKFNPSEEHQEKETVECYNENIGSQSTSTILTSEIEEIEEHVEHQEQEEEIEIRPEEYQDDAEPIVNPDESEFIKDVEELAEYARETKGEDENVEPQAEQENAAYYAEQYYEKIKEKEVLNEQNKKEEQETEEFRQEVTEEFKSEEDTNEVSKEITSTEEFEYLWEVREKLGREGKSPEEIEEVMHEAEEMYETLKNAEKIYEEQELEKLKLVDHEDEASEEDQKEDLDREDLIEQAVELEEKLVQQGESQEEIDTRVEESIETTKFEEKLEKVIEKQELEKLKLVDHEDEASEEDLKEDLDRVDLIEQAVELEEKLVEQGESQEEIDARIEESIETTEFEEKLEKIIELEQESIVNEKLKKHDLEINEQNSNENVENEENLDALKPELDAIESESEGNKDFFEETTKLGSEESDEEETEHLQELYRQETGRRPIYSRKKTKGYSQWLEQRELGSEKIKISKSESEKIKEVKEEDWKTTLKQWIKESSGEECNAELKSELKNTLESYNEFEDLTRKFLELYEKPQYEKLSEKEKNRLKSLTEKLQELEPIQLELLANIRAIKEYINEQYWHDFWNQPLVNRVISKFFKHISQKYKELRKEQKNVKIQYLNNYHVNQGNLGEKSLNPLTSKQIIRREQKYQRMLEELCVKYALDFKIIIEDEYGSRILGLKKKIPLSSHFPFRLDKYIRKVTHTKERRAVSADVLQRVREHIIEQYNTLDKDVAKETSFKKVIDFIREYKEFSLHVSGKSGQGMFSISNIKYEQSSGEIAPKSWLIENLRYMFPKKYGLPISDNLLSWFIYGDTPSYGRVTKIKWTTESKELSKRMYLSELLAIDYRINKLTKKAFSDKDIEISNKKLETLKKSVSFLIYYYVFGGYHDSTYVSETTTKELEVGKNFFTIEYEIIRAIFFAAAEANNGVPLNFEELQRASGVGDLKHHLFEGFGFGDDLDNLLSYFKDLSDNRPPDSNSQIFQDVKDVLDGYHDAYRAKYREFQKTREHATKFQGRVHKELEDFLGLKFTKEEQVRAVVKEKYVTTINDEDIREKIYVHGAFKFDGYLDLSKALKDYLGLDDKWMGIAFEAMGMYWHTLPRQKEADRKKRLICKEKKIILLEIKESWDASRWGAEALKQFKKITGVEIPRSKLGDLAKFLGI